MRHEFPAGLRPVRLLFSPDRPKDSRERLLQATHELLVEGVGRSVSLSEICGRADLNVALVKYYFGNKHGLLLALGEHIGHRLASEVERLRRSERSPTEQLRLHVDRTVRGFVRFPYLGHLMNLLFANKDPQVVAVTEKWIRPVVTWYEDLLREGRRRGEFRDVDPKFLLFTLAGACEFIFTARPWTEVVLGAEMLGNERFEEFVEHTTELIIRGVSAS